MVLTFTCSHQLGSFEPELLKKESTRYQELEKAIANSLINIVHKNESIVGFISGRAKIFVHRFEPLEEKLIPHRSDGTKIYDATREGMVYTYHQQFKAVVIISLDIINIFSPTVDYVLDTLFQLFSQHHLSNMPLFHNIANLNNPISIRSSTEKQCLSENITVTSSMTMQTFNLVTWPHTYIAGTSVKVICPLDVYSHTDDHFIWPLTFFIRDCGEDGTWSDHIQDHHCLEKIWSDNVLSSIFKDLNLQSSTNDSFASLQSLLPSLHFDSNVHFDPYPAHSLNATNSLFDDHQDTNTTQHNRRKTRAIQQSYFSSALANLSKTLISDIKVIYWNQKPEYYLLRSWVNALHIEVFDSPDKWVKELADLVILALEHILKISKRSTTHRLGSREAEKIRDMLHVLPEKGWTFNMETKDTTISCTLFEPMNDYDVYIVANQLVKTQQKVIDHKVRLVHVTNNSAAKPGMDDISLFIPMEVSNLALDGNNSIKIHTYSNNIVYPGLRFNVASWVIGININNLHNFELDNNNISITFGFRGRGGGKGVRVYNVHCVHWGTSKQSTSKKERWLSDGCQLKETNEEYTTCECSYISTYALSIQFGWPSYEKDEMFSQPKIILFISLMSACGFLSAAIIAVDCRKFKSFKYISINLCVTCFLTNLIFCIRMIVYVFSDIRVCQRYFGPCLSFSILASAIWMYLSSLFTLYQKLKYTRFLKTNFLIIGILLGWLLPGTYVGMVEFYYSTHFDDYYANRFGSSKHYPTMSDLLCWKDVTWYLPSLIAYSIICIIIHFVTHSLNCKLKWRDTLSFLVKAILLSICFVMAYISQTLLFNIFNFLLMIYLLTPLVLQSAKDRKKTMEQKRIQLQKKSSIVTAKSDSASVSSYSNVDPKYYKSKKKRKESDSLGSGY